MEWLIIILAIISAIASIVDKKSKANSNRRPKQVISRPIDFERELRRIRKEIGLEEDSKEELFAEDPLKQDPLEEEQTLQGSLLAEAALQNPASNKGGMGQPLKESVFDAPTPIALSMASSSPAISTDNAQSVKSSTGLLSGLSKEEKRKLIIYSEVLKPKYD